MRTPQTQVAGKTGDLGSCASQLHTSGQEVKMYLIMSKLYVANDKQHRRQVQWKLSIEIVMDGSTNEKEPEE